MKDIEVNGAHITDESAEILKQWQVKTEPVSAEKIVERIRTLRMMKKDIEKLSNP